MQAWAFYCYGRCSFGGPQSTKNDEIGLIPNKIFGNFVYVLANSYEILRLFPFLND